MCVDYTNLNKHCSKDPFGLPHNDQIIDSTVGSLFLSFLDCYSRYHQIALREEDQRKTSFITPFGAYCYKTMSWAKEHKITYQRAILTCLGDQIGENTEAYVDDVVVKTRDLGLLIQDLKQTFDNLKKWKWKLNVIPDFKDKTRYTPYVSFKSQISHIATNKGNIIRQCINI